MSRITLPRQVGIVVATARRVRGLTQAELAQGAGVSRQLVNRLETGMASGISLNKLMSILDAAGCTLDVSPIDYTPGEALLRFSTEAPAPETSMDMNVWGEYPLDNTLFDRPGGSD